MSEAKQEKDTADKARMGRRQRTKHTLFKHLVPATDTRSRQQVRETRTVGWVGWQRGREEKVEEQCGGGEKR